MTFFIFFIPITIFCLVYLIERRSVWIGFLFLLLMTHLSVFTIVILESHYKTILLIILGFLALITVVMFPFYLVSFVIALITSGIQLIKREGRKTRNLLSLALGLFIICWSILTSFLTFTEQQPILYSISFFASYTVGYFFLLLICFAITSVLNRLRNPWKKYDYIIVLGSGLVDGYVPPLLASRIDKGIEIYENLKKKGHIAKLVMTGGQGSDEPIAEGMAMTTYATDKNIPSEHILTEDKAVDTYENILFSKQLIDADRQTKQTGKLKIITVTNNFHVFRALLWARKVGVKSDGAGAKTKFYFWINALIREFIAVLYMQRSFHYFVLAVLMMLAIGLFIVNKFVVIPYQL